MPTSRPRKRALDLDAFSRNTDEAAFWTGFFAVRGRLAEGYVEVEVEPGDVALLERLRHFLRTDAPIGEHRNRTFDRTQRRLLLGSVTLVALLHARRAQLDEAVPPARRAAFWRGAFAGRGTHGRRATGPFLGFVASPDLVARFVAWLRERGVVVRGKPGRSGPHTQRIEIAGKSAEAALALLDVAVPAGKPSLAALLADAGKPDGSRNDFDAVTRLRTTESLVGERVAWTGEVDLAVVPGLSEPWEAEHRVGKLPPLGIAAGGRVLVGPAEDPLGALLWGTEHGRKIVWQVWVSSEARGHGVGRALVELYRRLVTPDVVMSGPFSPGGRALARAVGARIVE